MNQRPIIVGIYCLIEHASYFATIICLLLYAANRLLNKYTLILAGSSKALYSYSEMKNELQSTPKSKWQIVSRAIQNSAHLPVHD